jgi:hypothetical protein
LVAPGAQSILIGPAPPAISLPVEPELEAEVDAELAVEAPVPPLPPAPALTASSPHAQRPLAIRVNAPNQAQLFDPIIALSAPGECPVSGHRPPRSLGALSKDEARSVEP